MTPAAVELALDVRKEIQARYEEADRLRCRAIEHAQTDVELAQRRFMLVDPNNRLVADTLEGQWNEKLRLLAKSREERESAREHDQLILDQAVHERLLAMMTDFKKLWTDPNTPNRERKRLLAHIIEDVTLVKLPAQGITKIHVRFKGGKMQTLTTMSPKSPGQQVKTQPGIVELGSWSISYSTIMSIPRSPSDSTSKVINREVPPAVVATTPASRPCGLPTSSTNTSCAHATTACESAGC